jgi:hypothetical protein
VFGGTFQTLFWSGMVWCEVLQIVSALFKEKLALGNDLEDKLRGKDRETFQRKGSTPINIQQW